MKNKLDFWDEQLVNKIMELVKEERENVKQRIVQFLKDVNADGTYLIREEIINAIENKL